MRRQLDTLADRGCWISDDRVYAFVSSAGGICEIGYHGRQPVSRNSRILVDEEGAIRLSIRTPDGVERGVRFKDVEWGPSNVRMDVLFDAGPAGLDLRASGRRITIGCTGSHAVAFLLVIHVSKRSRFTDVHGERKWESRIRDGRLEFRCSDRIMLQSWLNRSGPYAGDFLIPEPIRRMIFAVRKRSGLATREDLTEEFRSADLPLYDAAVFLRIGGSGYSIFETEDGWRFEGEITEHGSSGGPFVVEFADGPEEFSRGDEFPAPLSVNSEIAAAAPPVLTATGFPRWTEFISSVPGIVDSCRIRDFGIPRATPGRYYWIWAWDALVSVAEALRWGDRELARTTAAFVDTHRDYDGTIPARWTRSLQPLDTPSRGSVEFLLASLAYELSLETQGDLLATHPSFVEAFNGAEQEVRERGVIRGEGFYPDLLTAFGRERGSAVCMEVGSWYCFCRILQDASRRGGDEETGKRAGDCGAAIARTFLRNFWDEEAGFFVDAIEPETGRRSTRHPLFSLLFLQSPFGLVLVRPVIKRAGDFVARKLCTPDGIRSLPLGESVPGGEVVMDSWYPHWDVYALKLLRRSGHAEEIVRWLRGSERVLEHLGYCPEFLDLKGFRQTLADAWLRHGSPSNLNCVTGWFRAMREGVVGIEFDPGGMTHVPLSLPVGEIGLKGIHWRGGNWEIQVNYGGPHAEGVIVDGQRLGGTMKIPARYAGPGSHLLEIVYGDREPGPHFRELVNAEVRDIREREGDVELWVHILGLLDGTFFSPEPPRLTIDDMPLTFSWDDTTGQGHFGADVRGDHLLRLTTPRRHAL